MFTIVKDFNRDYTWKKAEQIQAEINNTPVGKHVTLVELLPSGIRKVKYLTVAENGVLHDSHTKAEVKLR